MAILHHAFRCTVTPEHRKVIDRVLTAWRTGNRTQTAEIARAAYDRLGARSDLWQAFPIDPAGPIRAWLMPDHVSPGLAVFLILAESLSRLPSLSATGNTNHQVLATQLTELGWPVSDVELLLHGRPIETMLDHLYPAYAPARSGRFTETGGWLPGRAAIEFRRRLSCLADADRIVTSAAETARAVLRSTGALKDASAMLDPVEPDDWLVLSLRM